MGKRDLRIVFMGTPDFAVESLKQLVENQFNIVGVITATDKPAGRGNKIQQSPVKQYALEQGLTVLQPTNLKSTKFLKQLDQLNHNLQVVVAFRMLPEVVFQQPEYGAFNLHGSLLPQYRGAAPIHWAVMNGETKTGVTTFYLKKQIDTGNIIFQKSIEIKESDTTGIVYEKLMQEGAKLVVETCRAIENNTVEPKPQNTEGIELKEAPKIFREDCEINWTQNTQTIYNFIRGLNPYPVAWTTLKEKVFKIYFGEKEVEQHNHPPQTIHSDNKTFLKIATADGWINCIDVQLEGKKRMPVTDFLKGYTVIE